MGKTSGFEQVHGLLDRIMLMLQSAFITREEGLKNENLEGYWIEEFPESATFLRGHAAKICLNIGGKTHTIGEFGILAPSVLKNFELGYPVSTLEINLEVFL